MKHLLMRHLTLYFFLLSVAPQVCAQPTNDVCSSAIPITCGSVVSGTTDGADFDLDAGGCDVGPMAPGVWYTFSGVGGSMVLSTCPASYATILDLFSGTCGALECETSNFQGDDCSGSHIVFDADPGKTYFVLVNGFYGSTGSFDLSLQPNGGGCSPLRAYLDGPYDPVTGLMQDSLRSRVDFPLTEPYTALGYIHIGGGGGESIAPSVLSVTGPDAIVDWVVLELRDANDPGRRVDSRSALIQRDGDIVDVDGVTPATFIGPAGSYFIALRHRNHLGVMSATPLSFPGAGWDATRPGPITWGETSRKAVGNVMTLWPGDVSFDGNVKYTGAGNDRDPILVAVGGTSPNNVTVGYAQTDVNLNGRSTYTGAGNDRDPILVCIGGTTPNNVRRDFLPAPLQLHGDRNIHVVDSLGWVLDSAASDLPNGLYAYQFTGDVPVIDTNDVLVRASLSGSYLRKVIAASIDGTNGLVQTVQGSLTDVFADGVLNFNVPMSALVDESANSFRGPGGAGVNLHVTDVTLFHLGGIITPDGDEQSLVLKKGTLTMDPQINLNFDFDPFTGVESTEMTTRGSNMFAEMVLSTKITAPVADTTLTVELTKKSLPVIYWVPVAGVPIPILVDYKVNVDAEAELKLVGEVSRLDTVRATMTCDMGVVYDGQAHTYNNSTATFYVGGEVTHFDVNFGAKVAYKEKVTASVYNILGPFLSISVPEVEGQTTVALPSLDFDASLKASVKLETGIDLTTITGATTLLGGGLWESDSLFWRTPNSMEIVFGNDQVGQPDSTLTDSLAVKVTSTLGSPQEGVKVHFAVKEGGGLVSEQVVETNADGVARCAWTLGPEEEPLQRVKAWALLGDGDTLVGGPLLFKAEFAELHAEVYSGDDQVAYQSAPLPEPIKVRVVDQEDVPYAGLMVHFEVASGNGSLTVDSALTDADGLAASVWTLGSNELEQQLVHAWATNAQHDTLPPGILTFNGHFPFNIMDYADVHDFDGDVGDEMPPMRVYVGDQLGLPQQDIAVHFAVINGGGTLSQSTVLTDAQGIASCTWNLGTFGAHTQVVKAWSLDMDGDTLQGGPLYFTATEPTECSLVFAPGGTPDYGEVLEYTMLAEGKYTGVPIEGVLIGLYSWRGAGVFNSQTGAATGPDGMGSVGWPLHTYNAGGQHARLVCASDTLLFQTTLPDCTGEVTDVDGNSYPIGWVGKRCSMLSNLRVTHFLSGEAIPVGSNAEWNGTDTTYQALIAHVDNDTLNDETYGLLYNFPAVQVYDGGSNNTFTDTLCPRGWEIPEPYFNAVISEWGDVVDGLGGADVAGGHLKATTLWNEPNEGASNSSGFTAYPAGSRTPGGYQDMGEYARFWTRTPTLFDQALFQELSAMSGAIETKSTSRKNGLSCRCFKVNYKRDMP